VGLIMDYTDNIYGKFELNEQVIIELINSKPLQRLKGVCQIGYFEPHFKNTTHSRFEHSVGDFLLLKKFRAPLEEQIAGLIHDVSHSAFSHCIDYALDNGTQKDHSHQDNIFENYIKNTDIPKILSKHGFNYEYILNESNFPLQENNLPDLCADRIDYSFRTMHYFSKHHSELEKINPKHFVEKLKVVENKWVFKDFDSAQNYAKTFRILNNNFYAGPESAVMFRTVGDYLKHAFSKNYLTIEDAYTTDSEVLNKINKNLEKDSKLKELFNRMNLKKKYFINEDEGEIELYCKSRIVDPLFDDSGKITHVSNKSEDWKKIVKEEKEPKKYFISFEK
jgi:uncharacterized protein